MPINQPSRQELDQQLRQVTLAVRLALENVGELKLQLDTITDDQLESTTDGYNYTSTDRTNIRSTLNDLDQLRRVALGTATQASASDFFTFPRRLWGINPLRR